MSLPELTLLAPDAWLSAATLLLALVALAASWRVARRVRRERERLDGMRRDLQAFAEASTRVADALDHLLRGDVAPAEASTSSRRYLLHQARERLEQGEAVDALATQLDLCEDEKQLLEFLRRSGRPEARVRVA